MTLLQECSDVFSVGVGDLGRSNLLRHKINSGDCPPIEQQALNDMTKEDVHLPPTIDDALDSLARANHFLLLHYVLVLGITLPSGLRLIQWLIWKDCGKLVLYHFFLRLECLTVCTQIRGITLSPLF